MDDVVQSDECRQKTLGIRLNRVNFIARSLKRIEEGHQDENEIIDVDDIVPLVLWEAADPDPPFLTAHQIVVDPLLTRFLREHQRHGVQFLFDCLSGVKKIACSEGSTSQPVTGCILADDMGLGKTLQSITLLWTLLKQGFDRTPMVRKAIIVCPASLVKNWAFEMEKWLKGLCKPTPVIESSRDKVISLYEGFKYCLDSRVLITSYECLRLHVRRLRDCPIDLVICDEAHRLKNDKTKSSLAICELPTIRRLLLSGTPIQNDLEEFFSLAFLCLPNVFGCVAKFRKTFINPILLGREPLATNKERFEAESRLEKLSKITNEFILRRTNVLLANILPPKFVYAIFCRLTPKQEDLYQNVLKSLTWLHDMRIVHETPTHGKRILSVIQSLMKLCNHPNLLNGPNDMRTNSQAIPLTPMPISNFKRETRARLLYGNEAPIINFAESGKLIFLSRYAECIKQNDSGMYSTSTHVVVEVAFCALVQALVRSMKSDTSTTNKIVIVSNFTKTLDLIELLLQTLRCSFVRLDGATSIKKRHAIVTAFNDPNSSIFAFLLSSKAGGCGINLIGANRLVLFDPDWNPANDKQALARIWRDGQKQDCHIYRLFSTGTIEERVFQRQLGKESLSEMVVTDGSTALKGCMDPEELQKLFHYESSTSCQTHDLLKCKKCQMNDDVDYNPPTETDLSTWTHHLGGQGIEDPVTSSAVYNCNTNERSVISFVMSMKVQPTKEQF